MWKNLIERDLGTYLANFSHIAIRTFFQMLCKFFFISNFIMNIDFISEYLSFTNILLFQSLFTIASLRFQNTFVRLYNVFVSLRFYYPCK